MADDKKKFDKNKPEPTLGVGLKEEVIFLLAGLFLLALIINQIVSYIDSIGWVNATNIWNYFVQAYFRPFWVYWKVISVILAAASVVWLVYSKGKILGVIKEEEKIYGPAAEESFLRAVTEEAHGMKKNGKWEKVLELSRSSHQSDWRLAIMEADIMLEEALRKKGYVGESVGDILKSFEPGDFLSLDAAWEAHKIRNRIAHSGGDFELSEREARRVITLFESTLKELEVI
ncbi:MAG: hypothetical protein UX71_C0002G0034 [Parcubacteria group bacterium GW2011_GWA1_47_10]|uniref:DUF4145 domain-containing protein n=1 Tax=Candidatus Zambryskibacteria bacterium RIFCSPHIGHO2_01_FULL_46_25 TaxID=1802738 RepID=A0A1G2T073_9BACT|nr:MAG: hypothetical protein UX71_C0002G0034 [Parcubacteria group bacterium GW2011_GWA1_47_10]OHA90675.1 MAG: hypothetical protein A2838_03090 [Candidatus Zambryskibacteria bacterium RIFCSPHIGHO2_01_FULL_46_25]OHB07319.1 MAG: hypothetical protein A3A31_02230 [Candidatus Zambryskibacteria bacterium RIFCSPLOWO2_01_FULL_48_25]